MVFQHEHRQEKLDARPQVLHHPDHRQWQAFSRRRKRYERHRRHHPRGGQQQKPPRRGEHCGLPRTLHPHQRQQGNRNEQQRLQRQRDHRRNRAANPAFKKPINAETKRQAQPDERHLPIHDAHDQHGHRREPHSHPLRHPQPLLQENHAQTHRHQRVNEIPQGGINRAPRGGGKHVNKPVHPNQQGRCKQHERGPPIPQHLNEPAGQLQHR